MVNTMIITKGGKSDKNPGTLLGPDSLSQASFSETTLVKWNVSFLYLR